MNGEKKKWIPFKREEEKDAAHANVSAIIDSNNQPKVEHREHIICRLFLWLLFRWYTAGKRERWKEKDEGRGNGCRVSNAIRRATHVDRINWHQDRRRKRRYRKTIERMRQPLGRIKKRHTKICLERLALIWQCTACRRCQCVVHPIIRIWPSKWTT